MAAAMSVKMLSVILGLYFIIMGLNKLGPWFSVEMHKSLKTQHKELFKGSFFKLIVQQKLEVPSMLPSVYRQMMGSNEAFCGLLLLMFFLPLFVGNMANLMLLLQYADYLFSNFYIGNKFDKTGSVAVFLILLMSRMILVVLTRDSKDAGKVYVDASRTGSSSRADLEDDDEDEEDETQVTGEGDRDPKSAQKQASPKPEPKKVK